MTWKSGWWEVERSRVEEFHQVLERHVLVGVGGQVGVPDAAEQFLEAGDRRRCPYAAPAC
ncbi:hypothetical protein SRIMM317S_03855 [Streptomyces rimosus subsp. rimosus]